MESWVTLEISLFFIKNKILLVRRRFRSNLATEEIFPQEISVTTIILIKMIIIGIIIIIIITNYF